MEKLLQESIDFLDDVHDDKYNIFLATITSEMVIPKSRPSLRGYVLGYHNSLLNANRRFRFVGKPIMHMAKDILITEQTEPFIDYFYKEKEVLKKLKKLLNYKSSEMPYISYCGILILALGHTHIINQDKLSKLNLLLLDKSKSTFNITIPTQSTIPQNIELVNNMSDTIDKVLKKTK